MWYVLLGLLLEGSFLPLNVSCFCFGYSSDVIIAMFLNLTLFPDLLVIFWGIDFIIVLPATAGYLDYLVRLYASMVRVLWLTFEFAVPAGWASPHF